MPPREDDDDVVYQPVPDPPPTTSTMSLALGFSSVALMGAGILDLILAFAADCMNALNLVLGLGELALGLALLGWLVSWWLPRCGQGSKEYAALLRQHHQRLVERESALERRETGVATSPAQAPRSTPPA